MVRPPVVVVLAAVLARAGPVLAVAAVVGHVLWQLFGWPAGIVVGNLIASALCQGASLWRLERKLNRHHRAAMAAAGNSSSSSGRGFAAPRAPSTPGLASGRRGRPGPRMRGRSAAARVADALPAIDAGAVLLRASWQILR